MKVQRVGCLAFGVCLLVWASGCLPARVMAQPQPGDVFREYKTTNTYGDAGGAIRVGGKRGVSYPDRGSDFAYINAWIDVAHELDLDQATRAELVVEKIQSHNGTRGLALQWNDSDWLEIAPPSSLPDPAFEYYHHVCQTIPIELADLSVGLGNRFRLRVDPEHAWNWPQNLIYGVHLRVYYDPAQKPHPVGSLTGVEEGDALGRSVPLAVELPARHRRISRVDFVGNFEDVNWEGDGVYRQWHGFYYHGDLIHHLGSSVTPPYAIHWNTEWVPDQTQPMQLAARIEDDSGIVTMTEAVGGLTFERPEWSVELCKPTEVPENWVTRRGEFSQPLEVRGDVRQATAARLVWSSWSPGYMHGLYLNNNLVLQSEGPKYRYYDHRVPLADLNLLRSGTNVVRTGKTPKVDGKLVHGMEVNWPGIQLLIRYEFANASP